MLKASIPDLSGVCPVCGAPISQHKKEELEKEIQEIEDKISVYGIKKLSAESKASDEEKWLSENSVQNYKTELTNLNKQITQILNDINTIDNYADGIDIDEAGALEIASRSRGTPRIANRMLRRTRDFATVLGSSIIDEQVAMHALSRLDVDELGLDNTDRRLLTAMIQNYNGGPVGLETIAATIGEEAVTIEDVYEPYLMQLGFIARTPRGRVATASAYRHLDFPYTGNDDIPDTQENLFDILQENK